MQFFEDSANLGVFYAYEDNVTVTIENGVSTVTALIADDRTMVISAPTTLVPSKSPPPAA